MLFKCKKTNASPYTDYRRSAATCQAFYADNQHFLSSKVHIEADKRDNFSHDGVGIHGVYRLGMFADWSDHQMPWMFPSFSTTFMIFIY